jgi:pantothenate kinase
VTDELIDGVAALVEQADRRVVLGLAGAPAAGKSTLATTLVRAVNDRHGPDGAAYLPLDGFHLSNAQLERFGRQDRKGAPDTFDVWGYGALLQRIMQGTECDIYVPDYDRKLHEPVAARLVIRPTTRLIVTEGNYLASDDSGWPAAREFMNELWYVDTPDEVREARLAARQMAGGRGEQEAWAWVIGNDRPNGELVKRTRGNCSRVVTPQLFRDVV